MVVGCVGVDLVECGRRHARSARTGLPAAASCQKSAWTVSDPSAACLHPYSLKSGHGFMPPHMYSQWYYSNQQNTYGGEPVPAVALQVNGDSASFYNCGFIGVQDTLSDLAGRHYYVGCVIEGAIDFIFGYGQSVFQSCDLITTQLPPTRGTGYITAEARRTSNGDGAFVFIGGSITGVSSVYLGRPWEGYARVLFFRTKMSKVVDSAGWAPWDSRPTGNETFIEQDCVGVGANQSHRRLAKNSSEPGVAREIAYLLDRAYFDKDGWVEAQPH